MGVLGAEITDSQIAAVQDVINGMASNFIKAVANGRGLELSKVKELATGKVWLAGEAKTLGLIDCVINRIKTVKKKTKSINTSKENIMADNEVELINEVDAKEVREKARKEGYVAGVNEERQRFESLSCEFPEDEKFVAAQFLAGATVDQAKAAYADVMKKQNEGLRAENDTLKASAEKAKIAADKKKPETAGGAEAVAHNEAATNPLDTQEFIAASRERAASKGISLANAMKELKREQEQK